MIAAERIMKDAVMREGTITEVAEILAVEITDRIIIKTGEDMRRIAVGGIRPPMK
jgi:hypothetical protein